MVAAVWLLTGMCPTVLIKIGAVTESLVTLVAAVGLLACVCPTMPIKMGAPTKSLVALVAAVDLFTGMCRPLVHLQGGVLTEALLRIRVLASLHDKMIGEGDEHGQLLLSQRHSTRIHPVTLTSHHRSL
jgi:hypothetical protein